MSKKNESKPTKYKYMYLNLLGKPVNCTKPYRVCEIGFHVINDNGTTVIVKPDNLFKIKKVDYHSKHLEYLRKSK